MSKIRVAIIGTGNIAHCHIGAYKMLDEVKVVAVCDINKARADSFAAQYGIDKAYYSYNDLLKNESPDVVSVCTWNNAHAEVSIASMKAGAHVLCEKPLAMNTAQAIDMYNASKEYNRVLMPGFCTRYEEGVRLLKQYADNGSLGEIYFIKATYLRRHGNPGGWFSDSKRSGGGPVIDLGVHVLDLARFIAGGKAVSVSAVTKKLNCEASSSSSPHFSADKEISLHDVEDFAFANIRMDNGVAICFETSWNHHLQSDVFQLEVYGTKGGARAYPKLTISRDENGCQCDIAVSHSNHEDRPNYDFEEEAAHFINVAINGEKPVCTAEDGVEIMKIVDALYSSARENTEIMLSSI